MRTYYIIAVLFIISFSVTAQKQFGEYSQVVVPMQFEFLKGKDPYRLSTLTRFYLKQNKINAVYADELPKDITRCEVLYLDAVSNSSFVYTKVHLVLKDCNGFLIYKTQEGSSKEKEYRLAYQEAFKIALESFKFLDKDTKVTAEVNTETESIVNTQKKEPIKSAKTVWYQFEGYTIQQQGVQWVLKQDGLTVGPLTPTSQDNMFLVNTAAFTGVAYKQAATFLLEVKLNDASETKKMLFLKYEN